MNKQTTDTRHPATGQPSTLNQAAAKIADPALTAGQSTPAKNDMLGAQVVGSGGKDGDPAVAA